MKTNGGFYISQIKQLQDRIFEKLLIQTGLVISGGQGRILFVLWKEDSLTISKISEQTSLAKNTVSIVIDGMVAKGIVKRVIDPTDHRQTIISLTDYAKTLQNKYELVSQQMNDLFYSGFTKNEIEIFETSLQKILEILKKTEKGDSYGKQRTDF